MTEEEKNDVLREAAQLIREEMKSLPGREKTPRAHGWMVGGMETAADIIDPDQEVILFSQREGQ